MRNRVLGFWGGVVLTMLVAAAPAMATVNVLINPDGAPGGVPTSLVSSLDWNVGNALAVNGQTAVDNFIAGSGPTTFTTLYQSSLSVFNLAGGGVLALPANQEWTIAASLPEVVIAAAPGTAIFALDPTNPPGTPDPTNFLNIYYDTPANANDLAGTGFDDGTLILHARVTGLVSNFTSFGTDGPMDQFLADNYPGITSVLGLGATTLVATVEDTYAGEGLFADPNFFPGFQGTLRITLFNTSQVLPFLQVDPSAIFSSTGATGGAGDTLPILGSIDGVGELGGGLVREDVQFQVDANQSFDQTSVGVPEPVTAGLGLLGLSALALVLRRRR